MYMEKLASAKVLPVCLVISVQQKRTVSRPLSCEQNYICLGCNNAKMPFTMKITPSKMKNQSNIAQ